MRLAHHLLRHPRSGMWHFRLVVPRALRAAMGVSIIKRSLRTRDPVLARRWAYVLGAQYAQTFVSARTRQQVLRMGDEDWDDAGASSPAHPLSKWEVETPDGFRIRTDGSPQDHLDGLEALKAMLAARLAPPVPVVPMPPVAPAIASTAPSLTLNAAIRDYTEVEARALKPNTWSQRQRALADFAQTIGGHLQVSAITRPMASRWSDGLLRAGKANVYVANCVPHVAQLFETLRRKEMVGTNPVKGLVVVKKKEKAARRSAGHEWEPFDEATLKRLFDPANLANTRMDHVRWGALIGLYTGARVGEVAQVFLRDFVDEGGVPCLKICADSDGQSIKTDEGGERLVPLHPDLLALGLMDRVARLRAQGTERLFPGMRIDSAAGKGNAISKGFGYYLKVLKIGPRREHGIVGMHSLRKTVIQQLQGSALPAERRRALVGHEAGDPEADTHATSYMRAWTAKELTAFFPGLPWNAWLDIAALKPLLHP